MVHTADALALQQAVPARKPAKLSFKGMQMT